MEISAEEGMLPKIWRKEAIIDQIRTMTEDNKHLTELMPAIKHAGSLQTKDACKHCLVKDIILYNKNSIDVPDGNLMEEDILKSFHDSKREGDPVQQKTLAMVRHSLTWLSLTVYVNRYVYG